MSTEKTATVFGGTGFIGRYVIQALAHAGFRIKVVTRIPERAYFLKPYGNVGQIVPVIAGSLDDSALETLVRGSDLVVNCIGILYETRRAKFENLHASFPAAIARACALTGVERFVHISALGVDQGVSRYAKTKLRGEQAVLTAFPRATILRPSVVFGPEDQFFNMFAGLARFLPVLPLIGGGRTKFQPVYVGDIAAAVLAAATLPLMGDQTPQGRIYALGGPSVLSFRDIYEFLFRHTGQRRFLLSLPFPLARAQAFFMQFIPPRPLLTPDQVLSLETDNIVTPGLPGLDDLGVRPTGMEQIVPGYLERFRSGGRFSNIKAA